MSRAADRELARLNISYSDLSVLMFRFMRAVASANAELVEGFDE